MPLYNLPGSTVDLQDKRLRITVPPSAQKVTVLGTTDKTVVGLNEPYSLANRREDIVYFDNADGTPSALSKKINEVFLGGADNVEVVVSSNIGSGILDGQLYDAYSGTYDVLLNHETDVVVPAGVYIDSPGLTGGHAGLNFGHQLAEYCYQALANGNSTPVGVIGVTAPTAAAATTGDVSLAELETWVAALETYDTSGTQGASFTVYDGTTDANLDGVPDNYGMVATTDRMPANSPADSDVQTDDRGNFIDIGAQLNVVATWGRFGGDTARRLYPGLGYYNANLSGAYAGLVSQLDSWISPTNQPLPGVVPLRKMSLSQANRLTSKRFVTFINRTNGFVVLDGMTGAHNISTSARSDFVRLATVRTVFNAVRLIQRVGQPFIGKPINAANRNAMEIAMTRALQKLRSVGALNGFSLSLSATPNQQILGDMLVDLELDVAQELRRLRIKVAQRIPQTIGA